jgi:MarR family transcriptional regulator, 2-MHQ and catechol-resistance regulon repressor
MMVKPGSLVVYNKRLNMTSIALNRLARRGLVRRYAHPTDRRNRVIRLTAAGKKLIDKAFREHASVMEDIGKSLSAEERAVLIELLKRLGKHAEELMPQRSPCRASRPIGT